VKLIRFFSVVTLFSNVIPHPAQQMILYESWKELDKTEEFRAKLLQTEIMEE